MVMEVMRITPERELQGAVNFRALDISLGAESNRIVLTVPASEPQLGKGWLIDVSGTEYGGIVRDVSSKNGERIQCRVYEADSWGGVLNHVVKPPAGQDHYHFTGEANEALQQLIDHLGLGGIFVATELRSSFQVDKDLRYVYAYDAIRDALFAVGARLAMRYDYELNRVVLSAVPIEDRPALAGDSHAISITHYSPVNHLVCVGEGEMQERVVIDLYADDVGSISKSQTFFGVDEIPQLYEYTSADATALEEEGRRVLAELQIFSGIEAAFPDDAVDDYALDDAIKAYDAVDGSMVEVRIAKKIVAVDSEGRTSVQYEPEAVTCKR